ncbi:MAG: polysaccharide export protein [Pseudomonadota bacterium]|nr:polysaccharide export protein [Pseudomonadota bacterium]MDQ3229731.1 polysaccharide export protein [Pseudomonadota bacterium]
MKHACLRLLTLLFLVGMLGGCASSRAVTTNQGQPLPAPDSVNNANAYKDAADYRIGPQDLLEITVFGVEDLSRTVRVNANGQISLPLIGSLMAGGVSIPALEQTIAGKLGGRYLQDPQVSVFVKEFTSQRVTVEGAVRKPGIYPVTGRTSLLQAVALAEGLDPLADLGGVVVFRQINGQRMAAGFDMREVRSGRSPDPQIYGEDIIVVEQSGSKTALRRFLEAIPALGLFLAF